MAVTFRHADHSYKSLDPNENIIWKSVTSVVSSLKQPFDAQVMSEKTSRNKKSKWYGMKPEKIREAWAAEALRAVTLGTWYHNQREQDILSCSTIRRSGIDVPVVAPIMDGEVKHAPDQRLAEGIYPEHFVYLKSAGLCGQADRVEVVGSVIDLYDYKTNKEIKRESFRNWEGISQKMLHPVEHLDDCNFYHYALQLSIYMYIMIKHNPTLRPGKLIIHHITFEEEGHDEFGYPVPRRDNDGNPIVKEVIPIEVPYMKAEVIRIINWLHDNKK